jgi:hypothetical protein
VTKLFAIIPKSKFFWTKIILLFLILNSAVGQLKAQANQEFWHLTDGSLDTGIWDLVLGDLDEWQVVEGRLQGQLQAPPVFSSNRSAITPLSPLWPINGNYQFSFDFTPLDFADKNFGVLFSYRINDRGKVLLSYLSFHFVNQLVYIETFQDNFLTHKTLVPRPLNPGQTYHFHLIFQKPDFELYVDDQLLFSSKDDNDFWPIFLEAGRPLFYLTKGNYNQSAVIYSNFVLEYYPQLLLSYFSQLHSAWANITYDHSQEFFDPPLSIASSGCALTSAVMLLNYYGFVAFPDQEIWPSELRGKAINPATLNLWLKNEADGYLGVALVNWLAITRLSRLLSQSAENNQSLEFSYADYSENLVNEELSAGRPLIADLDGHFVVITGITENSEDGKTYNYLINDPFDSEHFILDVDENPIKSLRLFTSSQTDLSYLLLLSPEELNFNLINVEQNQELSTVVGRENNLLKANQDYYLYYWPKPEDGEYLWQFNINDLEKLKLAQLFIYQRDAQLQIFNLADYLAREITLVFNKDQLSELYINPNKKIFLFYHHYLLDRLLKLQNEQWLLGKAENANRYQKLIEYFLDFYQL